jgi:kynurenine formamidase
MENLFEFMGHRVRVIDLSNRLTNVTSAFEVNPHHIEYGTHGEMATRAGQLFGIGPEYWRNGGAWAIETVTLTTHSGTHVDAPYHYAPFTVDGKPARTLDDLPLRWCMGPGFVLDMRDCDRRRGITAPDVEAELERIGYDVKPYDIALVRTDTSKHFGEPGYDKLHPGLREDATRLLVERGVKLIGIDAWGIDRALDVMVEEALAGDAHQLWESHYFGAEQEYSQIERLANLEELPAAHGFWVLALPVSLELASGAWARVVALCPA